MHKCTAAAAAVRSRRRISMVCMTFTCPNLLHLTSTGKGTSSKPRATPRFATVTPTVLLVLLPGPTWAACVSAIQNGEVQTQFTVVVEVYMYNRGVGDSEGKTSSGGGEDGAERRELGTWWSNQDTSLTLPSFKMVTIWCTEETRGACR